jgi:drug/metabolite transporter (DMT)-like permease
MDKLIQITLIIIAGSSVAVADGLVKKSAFNTQNFWIALKNPLMILAVLLYVVQIVIFTYIFVKKWNLGIVGLMQMIIYAAIVIFAGIAFFQEKITPVHEAGMILALVAAVLMNL